MTDQAIKLLLVIIDLDAGTATFCRTLAAGLKRFYGSEFETSLLLLRNRGITPEDRTIFHAIHTTGAPVHNDWRRVYETIQDTFRLRKAIGDIGPEVILCVGTYANLLVPMVAGDRPIILSVHSPSTAQFNESRFGWIIRALARWRYPGRLVVAPSAGLAQDLQQHFGVAKARVIAHGIDAGPILAMAEEPAGDLPTSDPYIVACGRLSAAKDYPTLLRAYAEARGAGLREHLLILGDGEDRQSLVDLASDLGINGMTHFMGHRSNPFPYMKKARFLVLSSAWEGFGLVLVEAMTLGLPCISSNCPGGPAEILGDGQYGMLVPMRNPSALAGAMLKLASDPALQADLRRQALLRAQDYSLQRMVQEYRDLFRQSRRCEAAA